MHPAFSVIFFTAMSGAGYGLWFWLALALLRGQGVHAATTAIYGLFLGFVLVSLGLLSSTLHLGKPQRAWRAFSQWRTSWLSREGVLAMLTFLPFLAPMVGVGGSWPLGLLAIGSLTTVACTAMIYASLKPIPAWSHALVLPVYLVFALQTGGLLALALLSVAVATNNMVGLAVIASSFVLWRLKRRYWRDIDDGDLPATRTSALGLPSDRTVRVFERPHTEANYLTKEMGFVLARRHSRQLRVIAVVLFALVPALCALPVWLLPHVDATPLLLVAAVSALLGALVERWLFFAEAKHVVTLYY